MAIKTAADESLWQLKNDLLNGTVRDQNLSLYKGVILRGQRVCIPAKLQPQVLKDLHSTHIGAVKIKALARRY